MQRGNTHRSLDFHSNFRKKFITCIILTFHSVSAVTGTAQSTGKNDQLTKDFEKSKENFLNFL